MFQFAVAAKILARSEQTFHEEGRLHQVPAVVKHAEDGERFARLAIHEVGPGAVISGSLLKKIYDLHQPLGSLLASDEPAVDAEEVRVATDAGFLNADRLESLPIERAVDHAPLEVVALDRPPGDVDVTVVTLRAHVLRNGYRGLVIGSHGDRSVGGGSGARIVDLYVIDDERARR